MSWDDIKRWEEMKCAGNTRGRILFSPLPDLLTLPTEDIRKASSPISDK